MNRGWFALHRKIFESDVWQHPTALIVWIYILGNVTHQKVTLSERYQCVTLQPGQALTSAYIIAAKCRMSRRQVRTALNYLKSTDRVTIKSTRRFSIITATNFGPYREAMLGNDLQNDLQNDHQVTYSRPTADPIQEVKKTKKDLPHGAAKNAAPAKPETDDVTDNVPDEVRAYPGVKIPPGGLFTNNGGNGKGHPAKKGKTPTERFHDSLTPAKRKALSDVLANMDRMSSFDAMLHLHANAFTDEQLKEARAHHPELRPTTTATGTVPS